MLVRTPTPKPTESLLGYVLRVSEANGYETPWHVLAHAGLNQAEISSTGLPVDKLTAVLGLPRNGLDHLAYSVTDSGGERNYQLLGHSLGKRLGYDPLRLHKPQVCPHCVKESGYIDAFFDLSLAVACPAHRCTLVSECPACGAPLSWFRPGLLTCKCGASLQNAPTEDVPAALVDLMAILWANLHRRPTSATELPAGLPAEDLRASSLYALLLKLPALGRLNVSGTGAESPAYFNIAGGAVSVLADWPNGVSPFLARLRAVNDSEARLFGSRKSFNQLYDRFFNEKHASPDFGWFREEILRHRWTDGDFVRGDSWTSGAITKAGLAERLGLSPVSLSEWAALARENEVGGGTVQARAAAAYLELPVQVLQTLQVGGYLPGGIGASRAGWFRQVDLASFRQQVLALSPLLGEAAGHADGLVDMARVLRGSRFHSREGKAGFVQAYLAGTLKAVGRTGDTLKDILFRKTDVAAYVSGSRAKASGNTVSVREAAALLGCDVRGVPGLITMGYLTSLPGREGKRIHRESVEGFAAQYVALSSLSKEVGTTSSRLLRLSAAGDIPILMVSGSELGPVPFVARPNLVALRQLSHDNPARASLAALVEQCAACNPEL